MSRTRSGERWRKRVPGVTVRWAIRHGDEVISLFHSRKDARARCDHLNKRTAYYGDKDGPIRGSDYGFRVCTVLLEINE